MTSCRGCGLSEDVTQHAQQPLRQLGTDLTNVSRQSCKTARSVSPLPAFLSEPYRPRGTHSQPPPLKSFRPDGEEGQWHRESPTPPRTGSNCPHFAKSSYLTTSPPRAPRLPPETDNFMTPIASALLFGAGGQRLCQPAGLVAARLLREEDEESTELDDISPIMVLQCGDGLLPCPPSSWMDHSPLVSQDALRMLTETFEGSMFEH